MDTRLERADQARVARDPFVAAHEEHAQQVVAHFAIEAWRGPFFIARGHVARRALENLQLAGVAAQRTDQIVVGDAIQPRAGVGRQAIRGPRRERSRERGLNRVLDPLDVAHAGGAHQRGDEAAVFVSKEMLDQARRKRRARRRRWSGFAGQKLIISRISTRAPGMSMPGISRTTATAAS